MTDRRFVLALMSLCALGCGDGSFESRSSLFNLGVDVLDVALGGASDSPLPYGTSIDISGHKAPIVISSADPERDQQTVTNDGGGLRNYLVTDNGALLSSTSLGEGTATGLYQRVFGSSLDLTVTVDDGAPIEFPSQGSNASPLNVPRAQESYVVNVQNRDVTLSGDDVPDIRWLVVVRPVDSSDPYAVFGVLPANEDRAGITVRGEPAP